MSNRRRSTLSDRDLETKVVDIVILLALCFFCTSLFLSTLADHACGPAVHAAPSADVVQGAHGPLLTPAQQRQASEQAGQLAAYHRELF